MSNTWFQFKQFRVAQDACAMKVTTDACIQGAWTPVYQNVKQALDVGTGTGLLSLMLAQRNAALSIAAIELDSAAMKQADGNVMASPWADRIHVLEGNACNHSFGHKYDLIICNPPFFNNSLLSDAEQRNMARHTLSLSQGELLKVLADNLVEDGYASVLLPLQEYLLWQALLQQNGWNEWAKLSVKHTADAVVKRVISLCSRKAIQDIKEETLVIKDDAGYTAAFRGLLSPFYLNL